MNCGLFTISKPNLPYICFAIGVVIFITYLIFIGVSFPGSSVSSLPHSIDGVPKLISLRALLSASLSAAENGGFQVYTVRNQSNMNEKSKGETREGMNDPLTDGDIRSHNQMYYGFKELFPGIDIISEEHSSKPESLDKIHSLKLTDQRIRSRGDIGDVSVLEEDVTIWIDPLDATQEYTENLLQYVTTMVCVAVKGEPVIGVIHKPFENITMWAWVGKLVSKEVNELLRNVASTDQIIVSRSHAGTVEKLAKESLGVNAKVIPAGGAGYKTLEVVAGRANVYIHTTLIKKWDICAGNAILNAVGGNMTTLNGKKIYYGGDSNVKNEGGLIATTKNHNLYVEKLKGVDV